MALTQAEIQKAVTEILDDMTQDWDLMLDDPIGPSTALVADLDFASVDIIHLVVDLEEHFQHGKLGFEELLMNNGQYVDDLSVAQLVDFLERKING